jgi:aryl-alcohol dehydrogenase-like predicted oxidoreductase
MSDDGMIYRRLGRSGERVSAIGLGGFHIGTLKETEEAIRLIRAAIDRGINFMDNCWDYHEGKSEAWMGEALRDGYRDKVFLMTKIDARDAETAAKQIDQSLKRLQTDHIDLMQFHEIIRLHDPDKIFQEGGAFEAMIEAQKAGKVRYIGFTGHKSPEIHLKMLETADRAGFTFDAVQMPLNLMDAHFDSFHTVIPHLLEKGIGVLGMKPIAAGMIMESKIVSGIECLLYALSLPTSVVINGCDSMERLDQAFEAVAAFPRFSDEERARLVERIKPDATVGKFEAYKTTNEHDGTSQHPEWLGAA